MTHAQEKVEFILFFVTKRCFLVFSAPLGDMFIILKLELVIFCHINR